MPRRKTPARAKDRHELGETKVAYAVPLVTAKISSKNQITLPVAMLRALEWKAGDELELMVWENGIAIEKALRGKELLGRLEGSMSDVPEWSTKEKIDAWIREGRNDDDPWWWEDDR